MQLASKQAVLGDFDYAIRYTFGITPPQQLWLFWVAPIAGGILACIVHRWVSEK